MPNAAIALPPPLREGDHLDSAEFLRRWEAMPDVKYAELIDGVVYCMPSPVGLTHGDIHAFVNCWLTLYAADTPGTRSGLETTWVMGHRQVPQPDVHLRILPEHGGQSSVEGGYATGAPELIAEVTASTLSRDLGAKLELYQGAGVREYVSVLPAQQRIIWRQLLRGRYREVKPGPDGVLRSQVFPGLWLHPDAFWEGVRPIREALERGLQSPEHAAFVKKLATPRRRSR